MKTPNPIDFETDEQYEDYCDKFDEYLTHEEWCRNGAQKAFNMWIVVLGILVGLCLGMAYLIKYGII